MKTSHRLTSIVVIVFLLSFPLIGPVPTVAAISDCGVRHGDWTELPISDYPELTLPSLYGEFRETRAYALDPTRPERLFVTNAKSVLRSIDGGCSWDIVYQLRGVPDEGDENIDDLVTELDEIESIVIPRSGERVYLGIKVHGPLRQNVSTVIVRSDDGGQSWTELRNGLPVQRELRQLVVAPGDPDRLYAVFINAGRQPPSHLLVSDDGGHSWQERPGFVDLLASLEVRASVAVDPHDRDALIGWGDRRNQLFRSADAGRSWERVDFVNESTTALGMHSQPGQQARAVAFESQSAHLISSDDGGTNWQRRPAPAAAYGDSVAFGHTAEGMALLYSFLPGGIRAPARVFQFDAQRDRFAEISPEPEGGEPPALRALVADASAAPRLHAFADHAIWRYEIPIDPEPVSPATDLDGAGGDELDFGLTERSPADARPASLRPQHPTIRLAAGESTVIDYTLRIPPRPTPLDLGILVDTTGSMGPSIQALREQLQVLVDDLAARGVRLRVGLADYKEYENMPPYSGTEGGRGAYHFRRDLGRINEELAQALAALRARGGGTGEGTPALAALYQLATGEGQQVNPNRPTVNDIEPGQQLNYREQTLNVVLHLTDAPYREGAPRNPSYPAPSVERTVSALREKNILHVGIDVAYGLTSHAHNGKAELMHLARETGALAVDPVDCNGDGRTDIAAGEPLVCTVAGDESDVPAPGSESHATLAHMSDALIAVLRAVRDEQSLRFALASTGTVATALSEDVRTVDVTTQQNLSYPVRLSCPDDAAPQSYPITLTARLAKDTIATAGATLDCGPPPAVVAGPPSAPPGVAADPLPGTAPSGPGAAAVLPLAPPPPPAPVPAPGPAHAPAPAQAPAQAVSPGTAAASAGSAAAATGLQPGGGAVAYQEREETTLSTVPAGAGGAALPQELLASEYTASRQETGMPPAVLIGAGLLTATATYLAMRTPPAHRHTPVVSAQAGSRRRAHSRR